MITGTVQDFFEAICQRRLKNMVSDARTSGEQPNWIDDTLWARMQAHWATEEQKERSQTYSACRNSDRGGIGPHRHTTGPKPYRQVQREMVVELGRPVTLGEVFIRAHTKKDGTYIDRKAERIVKTYQTNVAQRLAAIGGETSDGSDGVLEPHDLSPEEYDEIFLESTELDTQGNPFGLGSLKDSVKLGKRKRQGDCVAFVAMQDQLKETQRQLAEQAAYLKKREAEMAAREAEQARVAEEQRLLLVEMARISKFMRANEPAYLDFLAKQAEEEATRNAEPLSTTPRQSPSAS